MEVVRRMAILNTAPEERFDLLTKEAVEKLKVPIATVSILDSNREWFKSRVGLEKKEGERDISFCGHAILGKGMFVVEDTFKDSRFVDNPAVTGFPFIRFYAGVTLTDYKTDYPVGVFCVKDNKPRLFGRAETVLLIELARRAEKELNKPVAHPKNK